METAKMPSRKRHTTSSSGGSGKSATKRGTSTQPKNSSQNAPLSFEAVFGKEKPQELRQIEQRLKAQEQVIASLGSTQIPPTALARTIHRAKLSRAQKLLERLKEHQEWLTKQ